MAEEHLRLLMARSETLRLPEPVAGGFGCLGPGPLPESGFGRVNPGFRAYLDRRYHKVVLLVDFIASVGAVGAAAVVEACESFASGSARQWLKVAGDVKADLIDRCLEARRSTDMSVVAEFGAFVGYSCVRMAWRGGPGTRVISMESDAVHVLVARHIAIIARQSFAAEVVPGMAHDVVARLPEEWGCGGTGFAFMDHRGTRFHAELRQLEQLRAMGPGSRLLADNTLKPGAPEFLWNLLHCTPTVPHAGFLSWSVPEFLTDSCEDWMTAADCRP